MNHETEDYLPTVSIIILNYNGKEYVDGCFNSTTKISYPRDKYEVIMIDNGSSDGSVEYVRKKYPWVKISALNKNCGFTGGNNLGVRLAKGDYVVFLNNDVVVDENWLIELVKVVVDSPDAIVTSKALFLDKPDIINHDGSKATLIGRGFCVNFGRKDRNSGDFSPKLVVQPYGASMLVKKDIFEEIGAFDEDYFTSLEDLDLGLRAWLFGHKVIYAPTSIFYHVGSGTGGWGSQLSDIIIYHSTKNSYMNILKYFDLSHALQGLALSLIYYFIMAIWFAKKTRRLRATKLILSAHIWIIKNISSIIKKRFEIQKKRKIPYRFLFQSSFFGSLPEMIREHIYLRNTDMIRTSYVH
jgi:GT2 family glycosyltransferase